MDIYRRITHIAPSLMCYGRRTKDVMPDSDPHTRHIALVGITGVGKSTLVNVLQGKEIAEVNNNVRPCTGKATKYEVVDRGIKYCIWDTRGLNEGSEAMATRLLQLCGLLPDAERELKTLLRGKKPKFDLVLLCVDAKKIKVSVHWKIYNLIYDNFCKRTLKVAVVATQTGGESFRGSGWKTICENAAKGVVEEFPDGSLMEAVPKFDRLDDPGVTECKRKILSLITSACS